MESQGKKYLGLYNPEKLKAPEWRARRNSEINESKQYKEFVQAIQVGRSTALLVW